MQFLVLSLFGSLLLSGCSGVEEKPSVGANVDEPRTDADDTGTTPACTAFNMALEQAEAVAPSVVRIAFRLTCDGETVGGKTDEDFTISEDGDAISVFESSQQLVPTVSSYQLSSVLVLDMSGSMIASGNLPGLQIAANSFISTMAGNQSIAIYTFDGREGLEPLVPFTQNAVLLAAGIESLSDYAVVDTSTNLNGAVVSSIQVLDMEAERHTDKLFGGTIAIFTDGKDQAGRVSDLSATMAAEATGHAIYSIGLGGEIDTEHLDNIGKDGAFYAGDVDELLESFDAVATDILNEANGLYVLAYCSPKRAGEHELEVLLNGTDASLTQGFSAEGFEGGCDPTDFVPPEFLDLDEDGYRPYDGDCDDADASQHPGHEEECDGVDNDCDGEVDEGCEDTDLDADSDADSDGDGDADADDTGVDGTVSYVAFHGGTMIKIDAQTFEMGCTAGMSDCGSDETAHEVTLTNDFYIGETEVSQGEYESVMDTNPSDFSSCGSDCPVEMVNWHMAAAFANAVSDIEDLEQCYICTGSGTSTNCTITVEPYSCGGYRLPTEAEWEAAARCGEDTLYAGSDLIGTVAWYNANASGTTHSAATKEPNACGVYDMSGNVWEWIQDKYSSFSSSPATDPVGAPSGVSRLIRGGSWDNLPAAARVVNRNEQSRELLNNTLGLRLVRTSP